MKANMKNNAGVVKTVKVGFSWTILFFGIFVYVFRGQWTEAVKMLIFSTLTFGIYSLVQAFTANKKYVQYLSEKGYTPATDSDTDKLKYKGYII